MYHKAAALQKEYSSTVSDEFSVQLSLTMHSLQLCREEIFGGRYKGPQPSQGLQGRLLRHWVQGNQFLEQSVSN